MERPPPPTLGTDVIMGGAGRGPLGGQGSLGGREEGPRGGQGSLVGWGLMEGQAVQGWAGDDRAG